MLIPDRASFAALPAVTASALDREAGDGPADPDLLLVAGRAVAVAASAADVASDEERTSPPDAAHPGYEQAMALDRAGRSGDAARMFVEMLPDPSAAADGCLGLAVLGLRTVLREETRTLAAGCLEWGASHPRACLILGILALEAGDQQGAQTYLAATARIARGNPAFLAELKAAQRTLLLMKILR